MHALVILQQASTRGLSALVFLLSRHEEQPDMPDRAMHAPSLDLGLVLVERLYLPIRHLHDAGRRYPSESKVWQTSDRQREFLNS